MPNRLCDTEIWKKDWFLELSTKQKLLVKFLFDNCDCAGFYKISWNLLKVFFNDIEITREDFKQIKQIRFIKDDLIFIEDFALFQCKVNSFDELNPRNKAHLGVIRLLEKYSPFEAPLKPLDRPYEGAQEKEQEKEKKKDINSKQSIVKFNSCNDTPLKEKEKLKKEKESFNEWHGEYSNVHLSAIQYAKFVQTVGKKEVADELINDLSENIASKRDKSPPFDEDFPDMHLAILNKYWKNKRLGVFKPQTIQEKNNDFMASVEALTKKYRIEEEKERARSG